MTDDQKLTEKQRRAAERLIVEVSKHPELAEQIAEGAKLAREMKNPPQDGKNNKRKGGHGI